MSFGLHWLLALPFCACATPGPQPLTRPMSSAELALNYTDSIDTRSPWANYWRIDFGMAPRGSPRLLEIRFDQPTHQVVKVEEGGAGWRPAVERPPAPALKPAE